MGQIYNRAYWKLPIVYGGFMGVMYAITWNNRTSKDYFEAYKDISEDYKILQEKGVENYGRVSGMKAGRTLLPPQMKLSC